MGEKRKNWKLAAVISRLGIRDRFKVSGEIKLSKFHGVK